MVNKEEFIAWKASVCYNEMMKSISENISGAGAEILNRAVPDNNKDQLLRGFIKGLAAIVDWKPDIYEEPVEEESIEGMDDEV